MNKVNFDKLKSIKTPEEWLENALNIPKKKKAVPFYSHTSFMASAACIALSIIAVIITLFSSMPNKVPVSEKILSETVQKADKSIPTTTPNSTIRSDDTQNSSDSKNIPSENKRTNQIAQTVTEPSEYKSNNQISDDSDGSTTTTDNSLRPNSGSDVSNEMNNESRRPNSCKTTSSEDDIPPYTLYTIPPTDPTDKVYDNTIYLFLDSDSDFDYSNTVGCHFKEVNGESLYSYNSEYEKCNVIGGGSGWEVAEDVCITYKNEGPNQIKFGLYEITFYDVKGNKITRTANISDNEQIFIF